MRQAVVLALLPAISTIAARGELIRYEALAPDALKAVIERCPVAYVPVGINEWHGEQSACGLDALKAQTLCRMAADLLGGVCFPQIWLGPDASTPFDPTRYPRGTLTIDKPTYDAAAEQILTQIEAMGFKVVVYLSGHYPGVVPEVAARFNARGRMKVISISENLVVQGMPAGDHAGAWETSVLMVLRPGLVDLGRLPHLPPATRPAGEVIPPQHEFRQRTELYGIYQLDPRVWANEHYGRRGVEAVIDGLARDVGKALGDAKYGQNRKPIDWPKDDRSNPEVRYDHLLPYQWMARFEQMPVVYVPVGPADATIDANVERAIEWARQSGGLVFPPISYAPGSAGASVSIHADTYAAIVNEIVADLADMDFRVIALLTSPALSPEVRSRLAGITVPHGRSAVVLDGGTSQMPTQLRVAIAATVPPGTGSTTVQLEQPWRVDGRDTVYSLAEDRYGPNTVRAYEYEWVCAAEGQDKCALLDLGEVHNRAEVSINGGPAVVDHWPPYRVMITGMIKPGANRIRIVVKNEPQPSLDPFFHQPGWPRLRGPVSIRLWRPEP